MNNKTTNILLGILIVVLVSIGIIMVTNQNRNSYRNDMIRNGDSILDRQNKISDQVQPNTDQQVITTQDTIKKSAVKTLTSQIDNSISSDLKTYTNSKYGFSFQYPSSWNQNGDLVEVKDLQGSIVDVQIHLKDTISNSNLVVSYSPAPKGEQIYQYSVSEYNASQGIYTTNSKKISVAGTVALQADITLNHDGRGNTTPSRRNIIVDFLDKQQTGAFKLMFSTSAPGDSEVVKFNQVLSSFKFI